MLGRLRKLKLKRCYHARIIIEVDFGIIARIAGNICLFHLAAIQDYVPAVEKDMLINGRRCYLIN